MGINFRSNTRVSNLRIGPLSGGSGGSGGGGGGSSEPSYLVVGAPYVDTSPSIVDTGEAYVYDLSNLSATPTTLSPSGTVNASDQFGFHMSAGYGRVLINARFDDTIASNGGAVYVYDTSNMSASPTKLAPSNLSANANFGNRSTAVNTNNIIIGGYDYNSGDGGVWIYDKSNLSATPTLITPTGDRDEFGISVAANDTYVVVGEYKDTVTTTAQGSVHVYDATNLSASPTKLVANDAVSGDQFGRTVAITDNYIIVGAERVDTPQSNSGALYVFDINNLSAAPTKLTLSDGTTSTFLGRYALTATNDYIVAGTSNQSVSGVRTGAAYVWDANNLSASPTKLSHSGGAQSDQFGLSTAVMGSTIVVGANGIDGGGTNEGKVFIYDATDLTAAPTELTPGTSDIEFGHSVALF